MGRFFRQVNWERLFRVGREAFWVAVGQVLMVLGALVGIRILTEILEPAQYGELALANTMALLLIYVFSAPLTASTVRFYLMAKNSGALPAFFRASRWFFYRSLAILLAMAAPFLLVIFFVAGVKWTLLCAIALVFGIVTGTNYILLSFQIAERQRRSAALLHGLDIWGRFSAAMALVLLLGATSTMAMLGYLLSALLLLGIQANLFAKLLAAAKAPRTAHGERDWRSQITSYSLPLAVWGVFNWLQFSSDKWALAKFATTQEVGLYAALYQIGYYPIVIVGTAILQLVMPIFFGVAGDTADKARMARFHALIRKILYAVALMAIICFMGGYFLRDLVFSIFVAEGYRSISMLLPWMVLAGGLFACGQTAYVSLLSQTQTKALLTPLITTALLCIVCNYAGAFYFGIRGVVGAQLIFSLAYSTWLLRLLMLQHKNG